MKNNKHISAVEERDGNTFFLQKGVGLPCVHAAAAFVNDYETRRHALKQAMYMALFCVSSKTA